MKSKEHQEPAQSNVKDRRRAKQHQANPELVERGAAMKKGWQIKTIGDLGEFQRGLTYGKSDEVDVSDNVVLRATNIDLATNLLIFDELKYISEKVVIPESKKVKKGSLMICMASGSKTHLGKVAFIDDDYGFAFGGFMGMLTPKSDVLPRYLFHLMTSEDYKDFIGALSDGANINNLTFDKLKVFPVPVPPLSEQHRIVRILDEAFENIATAKANAEQNLKNAKAIFESYLNEVFTKKGEGWVETTLSKATNGIFTGPFGSLLHKSDYVADGIPLVNPAHINEGQIEPDLRKTVSKATALRLKNYIMREGDIVIGRRGEMGRCALVTEVEDGWLCGTGSFFIKPSSRCDMHFLVRYLRSDSCKVRLEKLAGGAIMPNLNNTDLGNLTLDLPPIVRQKSIVKGIDDLYLDTQSLTNIYEQKLAALEELKKSLLHQAFNGEL
ncbi:MAG: restriction endonuclease subunit S [Ignavibacteria bacterium]|nr:restriction endonuclease subunit S [Ignavibacteria bacterium]